MSARDALDLLRRTAAGWVQDRAPSMGAAIAFYTILSVAPLLLIVISIAGAFFGEEAASGALFDELRNLIGENGALAVQATLTSAQEKSGEGLVPMLVGIVTLAIGATTVFMEIQSDLDRIWKTRPPTGVVSYVRRRLVAFGVILGAGFLLTVSLVLSAVISAVSSAWEQRLGGWDWPLQAINLGIWFVITTGLFALIYKILPNIRIAWRDVIVGAAVTSLLFALGKHLIGLYIGRTAVASSYGAAGAFVVLIVWVYFSSQIFLLGAEFTYQYAQSHGSHRDGRPADSPPPDAPAG